MTVTIKDVAKRAGVSPTTVSRAMNKRGYVSAETEESIRQAMEELNYSPNQLARSLFHSKTRMIGYVVPSIVHPFFAEMTQRIEQKLYDAGYHLLLCTTDGSSDRESDILDMLRQHRVEAIIIASHSLSELEYSRASVPVIAFDTLIKSAKTTIESDHKLGGRMAAQRLIKSGCRQALQIIGNPNAQTGARRRHQAFFQEMTEAGIPCISLPVSKECDLDIASYAQTVKSIFETYPGVDAYFAADLYALEILKRATRHGMQIPKDVQIIGYDGTASAMMTYPQLTLIRQPFDVLAQKTVDAVCGLLEGKPVDKTICIEELEWIEGDTTRQMEQADL